MSGYAYSNARIRGMKSFLLKPSDLEALIGARNLKDFVVLLEHTPYKEILSRLEDTTPSNIEKLLMADLIETADKIVEMSPCKSLLESMSKKYEIGCIKMILNAKVSNIPIDRIKDRIFIESELLLKLMETEGSEDVINLLVEKYEGLDEFIDKESEEFPLNVVTGLDMYYFVKLRREVDGLSGGDREIASRLIDMEIDCINIMVILRAIYHKNNARKFIIPGHNPSIEECIGLEDVMNVVSKLSDTVYGPVLTKASSIYTETNSLLPFELGLKKNLIEGYIGATMGNPFQIGTLLGFLKLKENEIENLRAICIGIENNMQADEIKELLIIRSSSLPA